MIKIRIKDESMECLDEAMADLKAMKAKYKDDPLLTNMVNALEDRDPSGNHKYITWAMKQLENEYKPLKDVGQPDSVARIMSRKVLRMADALVDFHNLSKKAAAWKDDAGKPLSKDLNSWNDWEKLMSDIDTAKAAALQAKREKEFQRQASKQAKQESDVIYDDDEFMVIRPMSEHASCYFGRGTKWCISATDSQNYYNSYTEQGKVFYFVMDKTRSNDDPLKKVAWVGDYNGEFHEFFDAPDNSIGYDMAAGQIEETNPGKVGIIDDTIREHLSDNLPDSGLEEQVSEITEEANRRMEHVDMSADVEDYGDGLYVNAGANVPFWIRGDFNEKALKAFALDIEERIIRALDFYSFETEDENVQYDLEEDGKVLSIGIWLRPTRSIDSSEELQEFANDLETEIDDKHSDLQEEIRKELINMEILKPSFLDGVIDDLEEERGPWTWDNINVDVSQDGEVEYIIELPGIYIEGLAKAREDGTLQKVVIGVINRTAEEIQKNRQKQLELPGMESEEKPIYQLGIDPRRDMTVLLWSSDRKKPAKFYIQNRNYTQDNREAKGTYEVMKLYNENPETFQKNVIDAIKALSRAEIKESKKKFKILIKGGSK
jgi:hypothetical protein